MTQDPIPGIEAGWAYALAPVAGQIAAMGDFLRAEIAAGRRYLPAGENGLRAFKQPFADVRVLIVGQDPYPDARLRGGAELLGRARAAPAAAEPGQHLPRVHLRPGLPAAGHR